MTDEFNARNVARLAAYKRLPTIRETVALERFIDSRKTCLDCSGSINDIENAFNELCFDYSPAYENSREVWKEYREDARALLQTMCPDMPARMLATYDDELKSDLLRAASDAERDDYCAQFNRYMIADIESSIDAAMPAGAAWTWSDVAGNPTEWYESEWIAVAMPVKTALDAGHAIWSDYRGDCDTQAERRENAADALQEYVTETAQDELFDPADFDERGSRYGDRDAWPERFTDYCETADAWTAAVKAMRAKLRGMIVNRAPLDSRAALVATVYGMPGA